MQLEPVEGAGSSTKQMELPHRFAIGGIRRKWSEYEARSLADSLGLELLEGDPRFNLVVDPARDEHEGSRVVPRRRFQRDIRMGGSWRGRPAEIACSRSNMRPVSVLQHRVRSEVDAHLCVATREAIERFDIVNKHAVLASNPAPGLPLREFAQPVVDAALDLRSERPDLGPALASLVERMLEAQWLHIVGGGNLVSHLVTRFSIGSAAINARLILDGLAAIATAAERRAIADRETNGQAPSRSAMIPPVVPR